MLSIRYIANTLCIIAMFMIVACGGSFRKIPLATLPENIYKIPSYNYYGSYRVGIFHFSFNTVPSDIGIMASELLYQNLLSGGMFQQVTIEPRILPDEPHRILAIAAQKKYNLIVAGDVLQYNDGDIFYNSTAAVRLKVFEITPSGARLLWFAEDRKSAASDIFKPFACFKTTINPAPPARVLLSENMQNFAKMMLEVPPRTYPDKSNNNSKRIAHLDAKRSACKWTFKSNR